MARAVMIHLMPGDATLGLWCANCLLPSGYEVVVYAVSMAGVRTIGPVRRCNDCGKKIKGDQP